MRRLYARSALLLVIAFSLGYSKTADKLKSEFAAILPAGKKVRMAWAKGGFWRDDFYTGDKNRSVYVVDSDDGIIRELTPDSLFPDKKRNCGGFASITADGSRVIFREDNTGMVYAINWDGTGLKQATTVPFLSRYWRNPVDNSDWMIIDDYGIRRVNVDDPTKSVLLWNRVDTHRQWFTLSPDGTHMGLNSQGLNDGFLVAGIAPVPNGEFIVADTGGCRVSIAHDNSYDFLFQLPYHRMVRICDSTGRKKKDFVVADTIASWASKNNGFNACRMHKVSPPDQFDELRWTNDRDFVTFHMYSTIANPYLFRLSDRAFVAVIDSMGPCDYAGNSDAVFLTTGPPVPSAPSIRTVPDFHCLINTSTERTVFITGTPAPTLAATGLPSGMSVLKGTTPSSAFVISGKPTVAGTYPVTLTAQNSQGSGTASFSIKVVTANAPPVANAGRDTTTRMGRKYYLFGTATDDGIPNLQPATNWKLDTNYTRKATISVPNAGNSLVTFADTGLYSFFFYAWDGALSDTDTVMVRVGVEVKPLVLKPSTGEVISAGTTITVEFQIDPPASTLVQLSVNDGLTFDYDLSEGAALQAGVTSLTWEVPVNITNTTTARIKVVDYLSQKQLAISGRITITGGSGVAPRALSGRRGVDYKNYEVYSLNGRRLDSRALTRRSGAAMSGIVVLRAKDQRSISRRVTVIPR